MTRKELLPDTWHLIWPELIDAKDLHRDGDGAVGGGGRVKRAAKEHAALAQARDLQRAKDAEDRRQMLELVKRHSHKTAEEYNAAKAEEFKHRGKPPGQFTAAAYRDAEQ